MPKIADLTHMCAFISSQFKKFRVKRLDTFQNNTTGFLRNKHTIHQVLSTISCRENAVTLALTLFTEQAKQRILIYPSTPKPTRISLADFFCRMLLWYFFRKSLWQIPPRRGEWGLLPPEALLAKGFQVGLPYSVSILKDRSNLSLVEL